MQGLISGMGKKVLAKVDDIAKIVGINCAHQSGHSFLWTKFTHGITSISKKTAQDMTGAMFVLTLIFVPQAGSQLFEQQKGADTLIAYQQLWWSI